MAKNPSTQSRRPRRNDRLACESVHFAEVEFARSFSPRLVVQFSEGLSILVEDASAVDLAAEFITAFRAHEKGAAQ